MTVHTIHSLAERYACSTGQQVHENATTRNRVVYNFKVTGFNISTVAAIVTAALAVLLHSPLFALLAVASFATRKAFMEEVDQTAATTARTKFRILSTPDLSTPEGKARVATHLGIVNPVEEWNPIQYQYVFRLWMNRAYAY